MRNNTYRKYMLALGIVMLAATGGLVLLNAGSPGLCPPYPVIGVPACMVMLGYFVLMVSALFVPNDPLGRWLFYVPGALALATGLGFSLKEIVLAGDQCPQLFGIALPLCFTAPPMVALMLYWAWRGTKQARST